MFVLLNGQIVPETQAVVPVNDRGFMYGDGLFETLRVCRSRPFRLAQHLERLRRGAEFLKIQCPFTAPELRNFAGQLIEENRMPEAILRVVLTRGPGERGYTPGAGGRPTLVMSLHPAPPLDVESPAGCRLITSSLRIPAGDALGPFKTSNKLVQVMARMEALEKHADEALLVNTDGVVVEAAGANLFWVARNRVCTVPVAGGALPGITRAVVLELCNTLGVPTDERVIRPRALRNAEGIFLTQSVSGIVPVSSLDAQPIAPSALVGRLRRAYGELLTRP
jgi:aminodeoxychorismate lyase